MRISQKTSSIVFISPLPPPLTGQSIAGQLLLERIREQYKVQVVDLSTHSGHDGSFSLKRTWVVLKILRAVMRIENFVDVAYLTISESIAGNVKDLLILWLLNNRANRIVVHLHGGSFRAHVLERAEFLYKLNKSIFSKVDRVIVTGKSHEEIFRGIVAPSRVSIVPNFAINSIFATEQRIREKFANLECIRILYVSGMDRRKGYERLLDGYLALPASSRARLRIDFAGRFDDQLEKVDFEERIASVEGITYHGIVDGDRKRELFHNAHIFCLPTAHLEGQPLSILEAYASGCVVFTTPQPGILDIFEPGLNGELISTADPSLLYNNLLKMSLDTSHFLDIALLNFKKATESYRSEIFCERMINLFEER